MIPPTRLPPAVARRLTPALLREMASDEMRLYVDHMGGHGGPPTLRDVERAALMRRRELEIAPEAWEAAEAALGWLDALVALIVVDRNRAHPRSPRTQPRRPAARPRAAGGKTGTLDLAASVIGRVEARGRRDKGPTAMSTCPPASRGPEAGPSTMRFEPADADVLHRLLAWRRDVRHFRADPVDEAVLARLRRAMDRAPAMGNARPWRVVRAEDPALRASVRAEFAR